MDVGEKQNAHRGAAKERIILEFYIEWPQAKRRSGVG
jgi:hypothetical protein